MVAEMILGVQPASAITSEYRMPKIKQSNSKSPAIVEFVAAAARGWLLVFIEAH